MALFIIHEFTFLETVCAFDSVLYIVEGLVGSGVHFLKRQVFVLAYSYTDRNRHILLILFISKTGFDLIDDFLCNLTGMFFIGIGAKEGDKLISAHPAYKIIFFNIVFDDTGNFDQNFITDVVTVGIVDMFEIIDIDHQQGTFIVYA